MIQSIIEREFILPYVIDFKKHADLGALAAHKSLGNGISFE